MNTQQLGFGFLRVAAISPEVTIGNIKKTCAAVLDLATSAAQDGVRLVVLPELCLAGGYTNADLLHQSLVQEEALNALQQIVYASKQMDCVIVIGLPLRVHSNLFNVAAVIDRGTIVGIVPKTYLPTGGEFQEARWFGTADDLTVREVSLFGKMVPVGADLLFRSREDTRVILGVELCEDVWAVLPPSSFMAAAGATVIANLSASNELVGKARYRRDLIVQQSGRCIAGYVYSSAGAGESTTDVVFGGHCMIAENGDLLGETKRFQRKGASIFADIDVDACVHDRIRTTSFGKCARELRERKAYRMIEVSLPVEGDHKGYLLRPNPSHPFVPSLEAERGEVCAEVFNIQTTGLVQRLEKVGSTRVILGLSGGLDSTLALLVCIRAFRQLGYDMKKIHTITMPGMGTTQRTKSNAYILAKEAGVTIEEIPIARGAKRILREIGHNGRTQDITYENAQARYRTFILMQKANQLHGIVIGTGDLSEAALGWCTYNGDHMSHYNVNCGVPKTLVRFVVRWVAEHEPSKKLQKVLIKILETPVSPELKKPARGQIAQKTEELIGSYDLHDFFLYHMVRRGTKPCKILLLAIHAFKNAFTAEEIKKCLIIFLKRFFQNQFKRSAMPDGPKVGSVSLSQRGDWRMPSDAGAEQWLADVERVKF